MDLLRRGLERGIIIRGGGVESDAMILLHRNLGSHMIIVPIITALAYVSTLMTARSGVGDKGEKDKYQYQYHEKE